MECQWSVMKVSKCVLCGTCRRSLLSEFRGTYRWFPSKCRARAASLPPMVLTSPSGFLPMLSGADTDSLSHHLENLFRIYASGSWPLEGSQMNEYDERDEEYERKFAVRWLTNLISLLHAKEADDALLSRASGLLAICSGSSASGDYIRSFRFTLPTGSCISVDIRDGSINSSSQDVLVGVQTWGSASILAQLIVSSPGAYLPLASCEPLRVLELGAGTGLVSLAAARILENRADMPAEIIASDYDLTVMDNLRSNIARNSPYRNLLELSAVQLDWQSFLNPVNALGEDPLESRSPLPPRDTPIEHPFDVIFGADIVYEPHQAYWIKATVSALLKRPSAPCVSNELGEIASDSRFHLVIPLRETHESESASVLTTFPLLKRGKCGNRWSSLNDNETCEVLAPPPLALTLATIRMEGLEPKDRGRPMGYLRYEIGWAYL